LAKLHLEICSGTSCHLMGSFDLYQTVESLRSQYKEHLEVSVVTCLGKCGQGPSIKFNGTVYTQVTPEQLKKMIMQAVDK